MSDTANLLRTMVVAHAEALHADDLAARGVRPGFDTGNPQVSGKHFFKSDGTTVGVWECTPGGWEIVDRPDTETMLLLKGHVRMTTQGEEPVELKDGDVFVLAKGWTGRWDVLETTRKLFVISE